MKKLAFVLVACAAGISAPALAQSTPHQHQHGQAVPPASAATSAGDQARAPDSTQPCDCCAMMKEMMQMMQAMHDGQHGMMQKMGPMQSPAKPDADQHKHDESPH